MAIRLLSVIAKYPSAAYNGTTFLYEATFPAYFPIILRKTIILNWKQWSLAHTSLAY